MEWDAKVVASWVRYLDMTPMIPEKYETQTSKSLGLKEHLKTGDP